MAGDRVECPRHWATVPLFFTSRPTGKAEHIVPGPSGLEFRPPNGQFGPAGPITNIPEFHDCQRFVAREGPAFDSLFAIFASFRLDSVTQALGWEDVSWTSSTPAVATVDAAGRITGLAAGAATVTATSIVDVSRTASVAVIVAGPDSPVKTTPVPSGAPVPIGIGQSVQAVPQIGKVTDKSLAAAAIYSYGPGYNDLGIGPNFNCLYVYFDNTAVLRAKMVHVDELAKYPTACLDAVDPKTAPGRVLSITKSPSIASEDLQTVLHRDQVQRCVVRNRSKYVSLDRVPGRFTCHEQQQSGSGEGLVR
jgi:hypothetical protein